MSDDLDRCDVVIVGAGVAGALIAYRLAAANYRVVMLEAGPASGNRQDLVADYSLAAIKTPRSPYADNQPPSPVWSPDSEKDYIQLGPSPFKSTYLRRVGGSTWHMLGNMPRHLPADFRLATSYGVGVDWPIDYDDLEPWYCEAETELGVAGDHAELNGLHGAYRSRAFPMSKIWPAYGDIVVAKAVKGLTFDGADVRVLTTPQARNSRPYDGRPACAGNSSCVPICPIGAKYDATVHVSKATAARAVLRTQAVVTRIDLDRMTRRVCALRYTRWDEQGRRDERRLQADFYVIAAHAIETPRLLLISSDRDAAPAGVANSSGQVGRNLMDHLQGQMAAVVPQPLFPYRGPPTTVGVDTFRDGTFRASHAAFRLSIGNDGMGRVETPFAALEQKLMDGLIGSRLRVALGDRLIRQFRISYSTEMLPSADNRVTLAGAVPDSFGMQRAQLSLHLEDYNRLAFEKAAALISGIFDRLKIPDADRKPQPKDTYSGAGHIIGTTRMGIDAGSSVVNQHCRAHEHDNLFIVGASTFPTGGTANPTLTVAALALRAASKISSLLQRGS
ncbi:GMC family oxidoreductase [Mesorhizobium sp. M1006]|uniref:GMC family oxidoreductase n=1 Tax=Mesorhizobium sp. M1006 TaxID=2957048 RepID=UPI00333660F9